MFRVLGVETRLRIIEMLRSRGPLGAKKMAEELGVTPAAISQHLRVLKQAGLVRSERRGYFIPYRLNPEGLRLCGTRLAQVCDCSTAGGARTVVVAASRAGGRELAAYKKRLERELRRVEARLAALRRERG